MRSFKEKYLCCPGDYSKAVKDGLDFWPEKAAAAWGLFCGGQ
jgi:hypothetical protein